MAPDRIPMPVGRKRSTESHPMLRRFMGVDALADQYPGWSPYTYTMNNPTRWVDPDGMAIEDPCDHSDRDSMCGFTPPVSAMRKEARKSSTEKSHSNGSKSGNLLSIGGTASTFFGTTSFGAGLLMGNVMNQFDQLQSLSNQSGLGLSYADEMGRAGNWLKWISRVGRGSTAYGVISGLYIFSQSDKSWGDYGKLGVDGLAASLSIIPNPVSAGAGVLIGVNENAGVFNNFYNRLDLNEQLFKSTGVIKVPSVNGIPLYLRVK